jgi:hypothetical protein
MWQILLKNAMQETNLLLPTMVMLLQAQFFILQIFKRFCPSLYFLLEGR